MNLKNYKRNKRLINIKSIKLNSKNLFIFLISLSIIAIIIGIVFYFILSSTDQETVNRVVTNNFKIKDSYDYVRILKENILSNTYNVVLIWILGISVIGIIANIFIYFFELFSIGFTISSIIMTYKNKSLIGILIYLLPTTILNVIAMFILTYFSIKISYKIISICFFNKNIDLKKEMKQYFKVLLVCWILSLCISLLSTYINPVLIKTFTNI